MIHRTCIREWTQSHRYQSNTHVSCVSFFRSSMKFRWKFCTFLIRLISLKMLVLELSQSIWSNLVWKIDLIWFNRDIHRTAEAPSVTKLIREKLTNIDVTNRFTVLTSCVYHCHCFKEILSTEILFNNASRIDFLCFAEWFVFNPFLIANKTIAG